MAKVQISDRAINAIAAVIQAPVSTLNDYAKATVYLYNIAVQDTSASRVAAQLLLSAYNSGWQVDITDLCLLDPEQRKIAMQFIECRVTLREEPHHVLDNGIERFMALQRQWWRLHSENRWRSSCGECNGYGEVFVNEEDETDFRTAPCMACEGTGLYPPGKVIQ